MAPAPHPVVGSPESSRFISLPAGVRFVGSPDRPPGVTFPRGFLAGGITAGLKQSGRPDIGVLCVAPEWRNGSVSAGVFTTNAFAAAPVIVSRDECDLGRLRAVVVNSGNANACTGANGLIVARAMQSSCAQGLGLAPRQVGVASTGIIGVQLDSSVMASATAAAAAMVNPSGGDGFAESIMTTDRFVKACALEVELSGGIVRMGVCGKGAGMISPALATMICVVTTDAGLQGAEAAAALRSAVAHSFNLVTVDGEMSTNDAVLLFANGASGIQITPEDVKPLREALAAMLLRMALMMVADGEGATKVIKVTVDGASSDEEASRVCRVIADSLLVKTAMHGGDPNWGRILSAGGAALPGRKLPRATLRLCGVEVAKWGSAAPLTEAARAMLVSAMTQPEIEIDFDLGLAYGRAHMFFSDLGHEYITVNAEYRS